MHACVLTLNTDCLSCAIIANTNANSWMQLCSVTHVPQCSPRSPPSAPIYAHTFLACVAYVRAFPSKRLKRYDSISTTYKTKSHTNLLTRMYVCMCICTYCVRTYKIYTYNVQYISSECIACIQLEQISEYHMEKRNCAQLTQAFTDSCHEMSLIWSLYYY